MNQHYCFSLRFITVFLGLGIGLLSACPASLAAKEHTRSSVVPPGKKEKPHIRILATGGTIAGIGASAVEGTYQAGQVAIGSLLDAVPQLNELAHVTGEQVVNIGSQHMTDAVMLRLSKRVNELMSDPQTDGIVITHGTDTMEETAFFLSLTTKGDKPVILVGSMRPSTALSADGPLNLYQAVLVAANPASQGRGVLVAMNGFLHPASDVIKNHTLNAETFQSPNKGTEGYITGGQIFYYNQIPTVNPKNYPFFDVSQLEILPKVAVVYGHSNILPDMLVPILQGDYKGMVYAGVGNGNFHKNLTDILAEISHKGVSIVRATRIPFGPVTEGEETFSFANPVLHTRYLSPQKARILLMLALTSCTDIEQIQRYFNAF